MSKSAAKTVKLSETPQHRTRRSWASVVEESSSTPKSSKARSDEVSTSKKRGSQQLPPPTEVAQRNVRSKVGSAQRFEEELQASEPVSIALDQESELKYEDFDADKAADPMDTAEEVEEGRGRKSGGYSGLDVVALVDDSPRRKASNFSSQLATLQAMIDKLAQSTKPSIAPLTDTAAAEAFNSPKPSNGEGQTSVASNSVVAPTRTSVPPAAIEEKTQLPSPPQLLPNGTGTPTPELFKIFCDEIFFIVEGSPKLRPLFAGEAVKAWTSFQEANAKFDAVSLEIPFLDSCRMLFVLICRGLDTATRQQVTDDMKAHISQYNFPTILNFTKRDDTFYQDCWSLMLKLQERFQVRSTWRAGQLLEKYERLRYREGNDPTVFLNELFDVERQLASLTSYRLQDDTFRAIVLLTRLPPNMEHIKSQFYNSTPTMSEVQGALTSWWLACKRNYQNQQPQSGRFHNNRNPPALAAAGNVAPSSPNANQGSNQGPNHGSSQGQRPRNNRWQRGGRRPNWNNNSGNQQDRKPYNGRQAAVSNGSLDDGQNLQQQRKDNVPPSEPQKISFLAVALQSTESPAENVYVAASSTNKQHSKTVDANQLILDSGANVYVSGRSDLLVQTKSLKNPMRIGTLGGDRQVTESGSLQVSDRIELNNVLHIPNSSHTLMSVALACNAGTGHETVFTKEGAWIVPAGTINVEEVKQKSLMSFACQNNLYVHPLKSDGAAFVSTRSSSRRVEEIPPSPQNTANSKDPERPSLQKSLPALDKGTVNNSSKDKAGSQPLFFEDSDLEQL